MKKLFSVKNLFWLATIVVTGAVFFTLGRRYPSASFVQTVQTVYSTDQTADELPQTEATTASPADEISRSGTTTVENMPSETTKAASSETEYPTETVGIIDLNIATEADLMRIKGIGEVFAKRIIDYREQIGKFSSVDELTEVTGIGEKRLEKWRPYLTVQ